MSFLPVCTTADVPEPGAFRVDVNGTPVSIVRSEGSYYAIFDTCSHANVSLAEGEVEDTSIECWLHGSRFDLLSGRPTALPATQPVPIYPVKVDGDSILVDVANPLNATNTPNATKES